MASSADSRIELCVRREAVIPAEEEGTLQVIGKATSEVIREGTTKTKV